MLMTGDRVITSTSLQRVQSMVERCWATLSRKKAYAPQYYQVVTQKAAFKALKTRVDGGQSMMLLDFDEPREAPDGCEVNVDYLKAKINDPSVPFGHGYVLAGALLGINPSMYTQ